MSYETAYIRGIAALLYSVQAAKPPYIEVYSTLNMVPYI